MKFNTHYISSLLMAGALSFSVASCDNAANENREQETTTEVTTETNADASKDAEFVSEVTQMNMAELEALRAAETRSNNAELKGHAQMMLKDHEDMGQQIRDYAGRKNIALNTNIRDEDRDDMEDLNKKSGTEWDKAWVDKMVDDHQKTIDKFEDYQDDAADAELRTIITNALPNLRKHLDMSKQMQDKMK